MMGHELESQFKLAYDDVIETIADYVFDYKLESSLAYETAHACLADSLGCAILSLQFPECKKLLGPVVPGTIVSMGSRVPGTSFVLDPIRAAFNIGAMIRWLDFNDTWLAAEWGHPSDNLGGLLAVADFVSQQREAGRKEPLTIRDLLTAMIKAYEIQGGLALINSFNRVGLDHVILVKVATTAVVTSMLGGTREQIANAVSNAWVDGGPLRTYRHGTNTGSRKSWAAGDQTSRGVMFAMMALQGEMGYPTVLTAKTWGFYDVLFKGQSFAFQRSLGSYVMENILFKIAYPAEFHAQTAVECAVLLHPNVIDRIDEIVSIRIETHESAMRIIDKKGPLSNPADRDHCLQYMVAIGLLYGGLTANHYEDWCAMDPRIDRLREKMVVLEEPRFSREYLDPEKRSIANAITITFRDGTQTERIEVEYPLGHKRRRKEGYPILFNKLKNNLKTQYTDAQTQKILELFSNSKELEKMPVHHFVSHFI